MSYNLTGVLRLIDKFSAPMRRAMKQTEQFNRLNNQVTKSFQRMDKIANASLLGIGRNARSAIGSMNGLVVAVGGAAAAWKLFDATIKASALRELSEVQINALFRDNGKAAQYMNMLERMAIKSPVFDEQEMFANSKGFVGMTKNINQLEKIWQLNEKLVAMDPLQGTQGASYALKELLGGDSLSMVERFELDKKVLNPIAKMTKLDDKLAAIEKYFNKMGFDQEFINKTAKTSIGIWTQIGEKVKKAFRLMGEDGLNKIRPQLERLNRWMDGPAMDKFINIGGNIISGIVQGSITGFDRLKRYIDRFSNDPVFKKLDTLGKIKFVIDDISRIFSDWMAREGKSKLDAASQTIVSTMAGTIEANAYLLAKAGTTVGAELGKSFAKALANEIMSNPVAAAIMTLLAPGGILGKAAAGGITFGWNIGEFAMDKFNQRMNYVNAQKNAPNIPYKPSPKPADTFKTISSGGTPINIQGNNFHIREEADVDKVARKLAKEINSAGKLMGGGR